MDVKKHYNQLPGRPKHSRIQPIRDAQNLIKSSLIYKFTPKNANVLDLCGGKGGDLHKYLHREAHHYVLVDVAGKAVKHARDRYFGANKKRFGKKPLFLTMDCFKPVVEYLPYEFDVVSCMFAIHYAFGSTEMVEHFFLNASTKCRKGGHLLITTTDSRRLMEFQGNDLCQVKWQDQHRYTFSLVEAVNGIDEFIVSASYLIGVADRYGFKLLITNNFLDYLNDMEAHPDRFHASLLEKTPLNALYQQPDQEDVVGLYRLFVFVKE